MRNNFGYVLLYLFCLLLIFGFVYPYLGLLFSGAFAFIFTIVYWVLISILKKGI